MIAKTTGIQFSPERPWIEFELMERRSEEAEAKRRNKKVESAVAPPRSDVVNIGGVEIPKFKL